MKWYPDRAAAGFTLLELLVVLVILATVTTLAMRSVDGVVDQQKYEMSQRGLEQIEAAVLGSPDDRAADGTRTISGFVADMGRLPKTVEKGEEPTKVLTLAELWENPNPSVLFGVRRALTSVSDFQDPDVYVPGGWRGPYIRLPLGAMNMLDHWGNAYTSPASPPALGTSDTTGYPRLRSADNDGLTAAGQDIGMVRHLGADSTFNLGTSAYDREAEVVFLNNEFQASLTVQVEVLNNEGLPAAVDGGDSVTVRIFGPNPEDPARISVASSDSAPFTSNPVTVSIAYNVSNRIPTIGPRIVRAYFADSGTATTLYTGSAVKHVTLRGGMNSTTLVIDRMRTILQ